MSKRPLYAQIGASSEKEDVRRALESIPRGEYPDAFCKINQDLAGDPAFCSIIHADGAGTKSSLAYMMYKETQDVRYFEGIVQDCLVMNLDDVYCAGPPQTMIFSNTIDRNKHRISGEVIHTLIGHCARLITQFQEWGLPIVLGGGETADVGDLVQTVIMNGTLMVRMRRTDLFLARHIQPHDVIVGLAGSGQASYESLPYNSGIGSNGLTLARHGMLHHAYAEKYPECMDPLIPPSLTFFGQYSLLDTVPDLPLRIGDALLSPTRTFVPFLTHLFTGKTSALHFLIHNTGGGVTKCLHFGSGLHYIKNNLIPVPPIFRLIQHSAGVSWEEMYRVFNMGQRLEVICTEAFATDVVLPAAQKYHIDAQIIGSIQSQPAGTPNRLTIRGEFGDFSYSG